MIEGLTNRALRESIRAYRAERNEWNRALMRGAIRDAIDELRGRRLEKAARRALALSGTWEPVPGPDHGDGAKRYARGDGEREWTRRLPILHPCPACDSTATYAVDPDGAGEGFRYCEGCGSNYTLEPTC